MNQLNQIILEGNVVNDVEIKTLPNGTSVCTVPLAVNHTYKDSDGSNFDEVSYFDVRAFGNLAAACVNHCKTGRVLRVVGRLKQDRWTDSEGKKYSKVFVMAEHIEFKPMDGGN